MDATNLHPADDSAPRLSGVLVLLIACALSACTPQSRVLREAVPVQDPDLAWAATAPDGISVEVRRLIVPNGPGSWVRDAGWDEYVVVLANHSDTPVRFERLELSSARLSAAVGSSNSRERLEKETRETARTLKDIGIVVGSGLIPAGTTMAIVGTSGGAFASAGTALAGAALVPVALVGAGVYVHKKHKRERQDRLLIDEQLAQRGWALPYELAGASTLGKSAFFPVTPAPTQLIVAYTRAGEPHGLLLALPSSLGGLHLKGTSAALAASNTRGEAGAPPTADRRHY